MLEISYKVHVFEKWVTGPLLHRQQCWTHWTVQALHQALKKSRGSREITDDEKEENDSGDEVVVNQNMPAMLQRSQKRNV